MKNIKYILMLTALLLSLSAGASRPAAVVRYDFKHVRGQVVPDKGPFRGDAYLGGTKIGAVAIYADALTVPQIKKLLKK
ncbi:MAG: hypothetical protein K6F98_06275 [Bacteroidales bacterium]|nr:hypothetical protein [Bacteroidales bacterium]